MSDRDPKKMVRAKLVDALVAWRDARCKWLNQNIAGPTSPALRKAMEEAEAELYIRSFGLKTRAPQRSAS